MNAVKEAPVPKTTNGPGHTKEVLPRTPRPIARYADPFGWMRGFADEMDRFFEDFGFAPRFHFPRLFRRGPELLRRETELVPAEWAPKVNVLEREGEWVVRADLPGLTTDEVKVEIGDGMLTIQGERKQEKKEEREGYYYNECSYGSFYRAIPMPEGADATKATADFKNGVLEVTVPAPVHAAQKMRRLEVKEAQ
jgi:HSP20 family protein